MLCRSASGASCFPRVLIRANIVHAGQVRAESPRRWSRFRRDEITAAELIAPVSAHYRIRDLTTEAQSICLVAPFLVPTGGRQRALGEDLRLFQMPGQQVRLA
jgi:hypothetical protein